VLPLRGVAQIKYERSGFTAPPPHIFPNRS
jgi:hypothetical protein